MIFLAFFQLAHPLFCRSVYNTHMDSVQYICNAPFRFFQLLAERREYAAFPALNVHHRINYSPP